MLCCVCVCVCWRIYSGGRRDHRRVVAAQCARTVLGDDNAGQSHVSRRTRPGQSCHQGCSGAGTHGNNVPVNILARERRSHKYVSCKWERWCYSVPINISNSRSFSFTVERQSVGLLLFCADFLQWCNPVFCCTRYSERRKFRPKMRQNAFGGRA